MKLKVQHTTQYDYAQEVFHSIQYLRLTPQSSARQQVNFWQLQMPEQASWGIDSFGNIQHVLTLDKPHNAIAITATGEVELNPNLDELPDNLSPYIFLRDTDMTVSDASIAEFSRSFSGATDLQQLKALSQALLQEMPYTVGATEVTFTAQQAFAAKRGVCQDHTHVLLSCCRELGIPARYVSGYLYTDDAAHVASHAWAEVWLNDHWQMVDVSNQLYSPSHHIKLAVGFDYLDACPVRGVRYGGGAEMMRSFAIVEQRQQ